MLAKIPTVDVGVDQSCKVGGTQTRVLLEYRPTVETETDQFCMIFDAQLLVLLVNMPIAEMAELIAAPL